jgi:carbon storage regulator
MLYLVRKLNESIIINDNIEVKIVEIKGKSVKIGFEFPQSCTILRKEVHDRIVEENLSAAVSSEDITSVDLGGFSSGGSEKLKLGNVSSSVLEAAKQGMNKAKPESAEDIKK